MKLAGTNAVHLHKDGVLHSFLPGDEVPEWAAARITNPHTRSEVDQAMPVPAEGDDVDAELDRPSGMPAKSGPAASRQVWEDYAVSRGIEVEPDWKRDDIIAAVEAAR